MLVNRGRAQVCHIPCARPTKKFMDELKPELKRKPEFLPGSDVSAVKGIVDMMNDPFLTDPSFDITKQKRVSVAPREETVAAAPPISVDIPRTPAPAPVAVATPARFNGKLIGYTGRLAAGKDYVAALSKASIFGFADPMYQVASHFFGIEVTSTKNKDLPGMRQFLQILGQWGKGVVSDQYPFTPARACFITMIRSLGAMGKFSPDVDWDSYGHNELIWTNALVKRAGSFTAANPEARVAVTNVRFDFERKALVDDGGWTHFHVLCSPQTWTKRLAAKKLTPQSKELNDISEQLAIVYDRSVLAEMKKPGGKLKAIWNDEQVPCPSPRLFTVPEFLAALEAPAAAPAAINMALE